jgi:uncharacterized membrane protein
MTEAREMLGTFAIPIPLDVDQVAAVIEAAVTCAQSCVSCADADLVEEGVDDMRRCVALDQSCADVCETTARFLSRPSQWDEFVVHRLLRACARTCADCAEECAKHAAHHRHCAICERTCRACEKACEDLLSTEAFEELEKLAGG